MDGIVPLQAAPSAPNPSFLKNQIISENADVLFDPIVPLPSTSKVRPKLRPVPRLTPLRRNSIQGSASEPEEEARRAVLSGGTPVSSRQRRDSQTSHSTLGSFPRNVNRTRNNSVCSSASQATTTAIIAPSPARERILDMFVALCQSSKALEASVLPMESSIGQGLTADVVVQQHLETKARKRRKYNKKETIISQRHTQTSSDTSRDATTFSRMLTPSSQETSDNLDTATMHNLNPTISQGRSSKRFEPSFLPVESKHVQSQQQHLDTKARKFRKLNKETIKFKPHPQLPDISRDAAGTPAQLLNTPSSYDERSHQNQPPKPLPALPSNIETGSLVVLTVKDPNCPSKKMLQTYIAGRDGKLNPITMPTPLLDSVVNYMKNGMPKSNTSMGLSSHLTSPSPHASQDIQASPTSEV